MSSNASEPTNPTNESHDNAPTTEPAAATALGIEPNDSGAPNSNTHPPSKDSFRRAQSAGALYSPSPDTLGQFAGAFPMSLAPGPASTYGQMPYYFIPPPEFTTAAPGLYDFSAASHSQPPPYGRTARRGRGGGGNSGGGRGDRVAMEPPPQGEELRQRLKKQLEFYFSRENLASDAYLLSQMDKDQYVSIKVVAGFNQVKRLTSDYDLVVDVLRESENVQVDELGEKVRPNSQRTTLMLREIPQSTPIEEVEALFDGPDCPKFRSCNYAANDSWYVNFDSQEDAEKAFRYLREHKTFGGKPILARIKARTIASDSKNGVKQSDQAAAINQQRFPPPLGAYLSPYQNPSLMYSFPQMQMPFSAPPFDAAMNTGSFFPTPNPNPSFKPQGNPVGRSDYQGSRSTRGGRGGGSNSTGSSRDRSQMERDQRSSRSGSSSSSNFNSSGGADKPRHAGGGGSGDFDRDHFSRREMTSAPPRRQGRSRGGASRFSRGSQDRYDEQPTKAPRHQRLQQQQQLQLSLSPSQFPPLPNNSNQSRGKGASIPAMSRSADDVRRIVEVGKPQTRPPQPNSEKGSSPASKAKPDSSKPRTSSKVTETKPSDSDVVIPGSSPPPEFTVSAPTTPAPSASNSPPSSPSGKKRSVSTSGSKDGGGGGEHKVSKSAENLKPHPSGASSGSAKTADGAASEVKQSKSIENLKADEKAAGQCVAAEDRPSYAQVTQKSKKPNSAPPSPSKSVAPTAAGQASKPSA